MSARESQDDEDPQAPPDPADAKIETAAGTQASVLGNLPKTRPSVRSPRRQERQVPPEPDSRAPGQEPNSDSGVDSERTVAEPSHSSTPDIEALARGSIAVAGEAASLGLRLAGRAAAAVRDAVERR